MIFGPRNWVVSTALGRDPGIEDMVTDTSEWVVLDPNHYRWQAWPELWVDKIHDCVGEECPDS